MTIGKKLYLGFGAILAILVLLFIVNFFTVSRERSSRNDSKIALDSVRAVAPSLAGSGVDGGARSPSRPSATRSC